MSIVTKTGDAGTTGLLYNRRVSKCDPRIEACGAVDELNAALGLARATSSHAFISENLLVIQGQLVNLMGELATAQEDLERYRTDFQSLKPEMTTGIEKLVREIEAQKITYKGWATPGATVASAALDLARTTCRRAERQVCGLMETNNLHNQEILIYLNRLSDLMWLMARWVESKLEETP